MKPRSRTKHIQYDNAIPKLEEIGWDLCGAEQGQDESPANSVIKLRFP